MNLIQLMQERPSGDKPMRLWQDRSGRRQGEHNGPTLWWA
jgi:hypothetical protein